MRNHSWLGHKRSVNEIVLIKCDVCKYYDFPELDEDGHICVGCNHPKVISCFMNFFRLNKCKYYRKITYNQLLKECKRQVHRLYATSFYYRDPAGNNKIRRKMPNYKPKQFLRNLEYYLDLRDFLFDEIANADAALAIKKTDRERGV